jgi:hypothetical protein
MCVYVNSIASHTLISPFLLTSAAIAAKAREVGAQKPRDAAVMTITFFMASSTRLRVDPDFLFPMCGTDHAHISV